MAVLSGLRQIESVFGDIIAQVPENNGGASRADMMNSLLGMQFGDLVRRGHFANGEEAAAWLERHVLENPARDDPPPPSATSDETGAAPEGEPE
jgi:hypothetical protein